MNREYGAILTHLLIFNFLIYQYKSVNKCHDLLGKENVSELVADLYVDIMGRLSFCVITYRLSCVKIFISFYKV